MANKLRTDVKDATELQKEMCMSSLKRALDDVEYDFGAEPLKKKTCLPIPKKRLRAITNAKKAKVGPLTHCRLPGNNRFLKKGPLKPALKTWTHGTASQVSANALTTEKSTDLDIKKKPSKRSADSLANSLADELDIKKRKVDKTVAETETESENVKDSTKPTTEPNASEATSDTPQQRTESPKLVSRFCGLAEYMKEGSKEYLLQQNYNFRKNVAFARQIVVYASDGSEYDYSDVDNAICDNDDDDDGDLYDDDDDDLDDDDADFEEVDPDAEVVNKRLNLQIADFFKLHTDRIESADGPQPQVQPAPRQTSSFGMGLFYDRAVAGCSGVAAAVAAVAAAAAAAGGGFEHDENGNDAEEFDRASAASNNLKHGVPL